MDTDEQAERTMKLITTGRKCKEGECETVKGGKRKSTPWEPVRCDTSSSRGFRQFTSKSRTDRRTKTTFFTDVIHFSRRTIKDEHTRDFFRGNEGIEISNTVFSLI